LRKEDATLTSIFQELKFDSGIPDASDRIADFWSQWYSIRKKYQVTEEFASERGRKIFRKEMTSRIWPSAVKERVQAKLEGLDKQANEIREDDKMFFNFVVAVAEENQRAFRASSRDKQFRKVDKEAMIKPLSDHVSKKRKVEIQGRSQTQRKNTEFSKDSKNSVRTEGKFKKRFTGKCLKCGKQGHKVRDCFKVKSPEEAREFLSKHLNERGQDKPRLPSLGETERLKVMLNGRVQADAILDSAASHTFIPQDLVGKLGLKLDAWAGGEVNWVARGVSLPVMGVVLIDLQLDIAEGGSVVIRRVKALVLPGKILDDANLVFVGTVELNSLGIHPLHQLKTSLRRNDKDVVGEEELGDSLVVLPSIVADGTAGGSIVYSEDVGDTAEDGTAGSIVEENCLGDIVTSKVGDGTAAKPNKEVAHRTVKDGTTRNCDTTNSIVIDGTADPACLNERSDKEFDESIWQRLENYLNPKSWNDLEPSRRDLLMTVVRMVNSSDGITKEEKLKLLDISLEYEDIWCISLIDKGPAKVTPSVLQLKSGATPKRTKLRKYPEEHLKFMTSFVQDLERAGCIFRNPNSRWSSPVYVVKKPGGGYRMTIDLRYVNSQLEPVAGIMPHMDIVLKKLSGSKFFSTIDCFKGYWQFPLAERSREYMSFATPGGIWTSTRLLQGQSDAVFLFQSGMQEVLGDLLNRCALLWVDDVFQYASSFSDLMKNLKKMFSRMREKNVSLSPLKSTLCSTSVTWCGRKIDASGVKFDDKLIQGLLDLERPKTAQQLQQFICACNWVRSSIPMFSKEISPLQALLQKYTCEAGSMKANVLRKFNIDWNEDHNNCFFKIKSLLSNQVKLVHLDSTQQLCLFTDASDAFYGIVLTQIPENDVEKPFEEQLHSPLAFLSGKFTKSQLNWSTIEKEAYPIVVAMTKLRHFLLNNKGFRLFTDHRNLVFVFSPTGVKKASTERLIRWSDLISSYRFVVEHISGVSNVWADLLSRWQTKDSGHPLLASLNLRTPTTLEDFSWPSLDEIRSAQLNHESTPESLVLHETLLSKEGRIWVPTHILQVRIMIIAHCSLSGHRGIDVTLKLVEKRFWWEMMKSDIRDFVLNCLHCSVNKAQVVPRPFAEQMHASERNEIIHYDYLYVNNRNPNFSYILVIKEDLSHFVRLIPAKTCDHFAVAEALMDWYADFGCPRVHISDQGSHFKNSVIAELHRLSGSRHHYTIAYSPWSNGTVEVVNESILRCLRSLLSEFKLKSSEWPKLLSLVQGVLNHSPSRTLGGLSPVTAFTGLPAHDPFCSIYPGSSKTWRTSRLTPEEIIKMHEDLKQSLIDMHKSMSQKKEKIRSGKREIRNTKLTCKPNFDLGDYVLVATAHRKDKLESKWKGPQRVIKVINDQVFEVEDLLTGNRKEVHSVRLMHFKDSEIDSNVKEHIQFHASSYEVEKILDSRISKGQREVLVKWRGFDDREATWEPSEVIREDVPNLVEEFDNKRQKRY
jgi:hypothetical protein